jgi:hypothetical protein
MSAKKIGRNDPCPCGSGKKYKHCCLRKDRTRRTVAQANSARMEPDGGSETQLAHIKSMAQTLLPHVPPEEVQGLKQILEKMDEIAAYEAMSGEIDAAAEVLEKHRAELEAMMQESEEVVERAQCLFAEERFAPWRFTADDVYHAFEAVGYPQRVQIDAEENQEIIDAAILHLAGEERRGHLARQLMKLLPEYVAAGRYRDAWLIQYCAWQMFEHRDGINAFLFEMFGYGFEAWATQIEDQKEAIVRELGFGPDQIRDSGMSVEELEARFQAQMADPEKKARLEAYYAQHAMMNAQSEAEVWELERGAISLLEHEDAGPLYLTVEEMQPWITPLLDRLEPFQGQGLQAAKEGRFDDPVLISVLRDGMMDVSKEMAAALFTPERVAQFVQVIKAYRRDLLAAKESQAAMYAHGALLSLEHVQDPAENPRQARPHRGIRVGRTQCGRPDRRPGEAGPGIA